MKKSKLKRKNKELIKRCEALANIVINLTAQKRILIDFPNSKEAESVKVKSRFDVVLEKLCWL